MRLVGGLVGGGRVVNGDSEGPDLGQGSRTGTAGGWRAIRGYPVLEDKPLSGKWKVLARESQSTDMLSNVVEKLTICWA